jgi:alpha-L-fucosidase
VTPYRENACEPALTRRRFLTLAAAGLPALGMSSRRVAAHQSRRPVPSAAQLEWQRDELALFLHFGINTFTDREWGDGREDPGIFLPPRLDPRQWARVARAAGFRAMILTAKHHDGFCLWPTRTTDHSVAHSPWRGGRGDVVREFVDACHAEGLKAGLYCSPWDRHEPSYGDSQRYNDLYCDQLTELLTQYGPIQEFWFDGANGEGPDGRRQSYDWPRFWSLVRRHQPDAVIFSDAGPDIRWIGNEHGLAGDPNWSTVDPDAVPYPGATGEAVSRMLLHGDPAGSVWRPGETDVSIRPGWFYHKSEDDRVKSTDQLVDLYFTSVGRNSKLLLNVPPSPDGLLNEMDVARLTEMRDRLTSLLQENLVPVQSVRWTATGARSAVAEIDLGRTVTIGIADLREDISRGQIVARYALQGLNGEDWQTLASGTTIGHRKLDRFEPVRVRHVRLRIEDAVESPRPVELRLHTGAS